VINLVSYFEIGGHIHECEVYETQSVRASHVQDVMETKMELTRSFSGNYKNPTNTSYIYKPKLTGVKTFRNLSRAGRAHRAAVLAAGLAAADGPLPIGDLMAIGVLSAYAGYETYRILDDVL